MIPIIVGAGAGFMILCEVLFEGRKWPQVRGWWLRAIFLNAVQVGSAWLATFAWDPWMADRRPWSADGLGVTGGAVVYVLRSPR